MLAKVFAALSSAFAAAAEEATQLEPSVAALLFAQNLSAGKRYECPPGYTLVGKQCVTRDETPPRYLCPPGAVEIHGGCFVIASQPPYKMSKCPLDATVVGLGSDCLKIRETPPLLRCAFENAVLNAEQTLCTISLPQSCDGPDEFWDEVSGGCFAVVPVEKVCPPQFHMTGKHCVREIRETPSLKCPLGFTLDDGLTCLKKSDRKKFICPSEDYTLRSGSCTKIAAKLRMSCADGFATVGEFCVRTLGFAPSVNCTFPYVLEDETCVWRTPATAVCPVVSAGEKCHEVVEERTPVCPIDSELQEGYLCSRKRYFVSTMTCPVGFEIVAGVCTRVSETPAAARCVVGELSKDECVHEVRSAAVLSCPAGDFGLVGSDSPSVLGAPPAVSCVRQLPSKCSSTVTTLECDAAPAIAQLLTTGPAARDYKLKATLAEALAAAAAAPDGKHAPEMPYRENFDCKNVTRVIEQPCFEEETAPVERHCLPGAVLEGSSCVTRITSPPIYSCDDLEGAYLERASGNCVSVETVSAEAVCAAGTALTDDRHCVMEDSTEPEWNCPAGTVPQAPQEGSGSEDLVCVRPVKKIVRPEVVRVEQPTRRCSRGRLTRNENTGEFACEVAEVQAPDFACAPGGTAINGTACTHSVPPTTEAVLERVPPEPVCAGEKTAPTAPEQMCTRVETAELEYACEKGTRQGLRCVVPRPATAAGLGTLHRGPAPPLKTCPPESVFDESRGACVAHVVVAREETVDTCPLGFEILRVESKTVCAREVARIPACERGAYLTDRSSCMHEAVLPVRIVSTKICSKGSRDC